MATNSSDKRLVHLNEVTVAMVPWPEHGHLNLLFYLARIIASHNIPVHFLCLAARNQDLRKRLQGGLQLQTSIENLGDSNIHFNDLLVPSSPTETKDVFLERLGEFISRTCHELSTNTKRLVIIHDCLMISYIGDHLHLMSNFKCYAFHPTSAFTRYSSLRQTIHIVDEDHDEMIQQLGEEFPTVESTFGPNMAEHVEKELKWKHNSGDIINSIKIISIGCLYLSQFRNILYEVLMSLNNQVIVIPLVTISLRLSLYLLPSYKIHLLSPFFRRWRFTLSSQPVFVV